MSEAKVNAVTQEAAEKAASSTPAKNEDLIVQLRKPFQFGSETIETVDLNGLTRLTARDLLEIDDYIVQRRDSRDYLTIFAHPHYMYYLAFMASGYPMEVFQNMPIRTMRDIDRVINEYIGSIDDDLDDGGVIHLLDPFTLNGKQVTELDLSGVEEVSGAVTEKAKRTVKRERNYRKYQADGWDIMHQAYHFAIAASVLGCRASDLNDLSWRDAMRVRTAVIHFLYS